MGSDSRRQWTVEEKLQILDEARKAGQALSEVCRQLQIAPGQFYQWEQQARKGPLQALRNGKRGRKPRKTEEHLKTEVTRLRTVVAELSAETLQFKKGLWPKRHRRYTASEKTLLLEAVHHAQEVLRRPCCLL